MSTVLSLGEAMIRLSSFNGERLKNSTQLNLTYGGAEYNVAINLSQLNHQVRFASKVPDNQLSNNLINLLHSFQVNTDFLLIGGERLGSYYLEAGSGLRPSNVIYDRKFTSIAMMKDIEWDLDQLFDRVDLLHITGITLGLSEAWHRLGVEIIQEASRRGIKISFDMNFRQKLWSQAQARAVYKKVLPYVDYLNAGVLDAIHFMEVPEKEGVDFKYYIKEISKAYPNLTYIYGTNRENITPNSFRLSGFIYEVDDQQFHHSKEYRLDIVVDRVGAGDAYASGILDGFLSNYPLADTVEFGMAASVLKHTIYGDVNQFSREEVESFMSNSQNIVR